MTRPIPPLGADDHILGTSDALVTLVEYGDYQCPYCGAAYPVLKTVQRAMGTDLRFVFRNFPLVEVHNHALHAAEFAEAAAEAGRYWQAHDMLFENQNSLGDENLVAYGDRLGLHRTSLAAAFEGRHDAKIQRDFIGGVRGGVNGTPSLFIEGVLYAGPMETELLIEALRQAATRRS